ncbi:MAG: helix-turn-helix domain-containing protein [Burkholderiales bacterium]|nr:helix-turn-helix domain-containing protein [Burkholderiales bacterium]
MDAAETTLPAGSSPASPSPGTRPAPRPEGHALSAAAIDRMAEDADFVTAFGRGIAVLLALSDKRRRMSIAQVSHQTGIPRATVRRSLHTLVRLGFVAVDEARRFYLRPRVLSFSHAYLSASPIVVLSQPILDRLGEMLREGCSLATLDDDEIVYLARSATSRVMSPFLNVGRRLPAYCTSIGRVMLAHLLPAELDRYLADLRPIPYTEHTTTDIGELRAILARVRETGFAYASQQMELRLCTLAVPVHDTSGQVVAGINVILQHRLVPMEEMSARFLVPLQQAALELGSALLP